MAIVDPMSEDLRRQRRNLIVISFILCFMKYGGIVITKTTLFGTEIKFTNISAIFMALWLLWFYFAIRYYQYFMQEGVGKIRISLNDVLTVKCRDSIKEIVTSKNPNLHTYQQTFDYNILKKSNWHTILFSGEEHHRDGYGGVEVIKFEMNINMFGFWKEVLKSYSIVILNQSVVNDYLFPVIFAAVTLIYCNLGDWNGKLLNLL